MSENTEWMETGDPEDGFAKWLEEWRAHFFDGFDAFHVRLPEDEEPEALLGHPVRPSEDLIEQWAKAFLSARLGLPMQVLESGPVIYMRFPTLGGE